MDDMRRILITGSAGFIGLAVSKEMSANGWIVHGYDRKSFPDMDVTAANFRTVLDDLTRLSDDLIVLHLAAEVGKLNCEQNSTRALEVNVGGTLNVARACADYGVPLVYCSTSEVYGDVGELEVDEDGFWEDIGGLGSPTGVPVGPLSGTYALTKFWGEQVAQTYAPEGLKIIRPTMPYGPGVPPGLGRRALDNLVWQALTGQPIVVHRGASRSWCWIDDLVSGFRTVIERGEPGVYNVGRDDDEYPMSSLAAKICQVVADVDEDLYERMVSSIEIVDPPSRQTAIKRISCAKLRALGWEPKVSLDDGLLKMVEWIKDWLIEQHDALRPDDRHSYYHRPYLGHRDSHS